MLLLLFYFGWFSNSLMPIAFRWVATHSESASNLKTRKGIANSASGYGKITFTNGLKQMVRVHLSPTVTWNHFERRSNETLRTNPNRRIGFQRVP